MRYFIDTIAAANTNNVVQEILDILVDQSIKGYYDYTNDELVFHDPLSKEEVSNILDVHMYYVIAIR